jgi:cold shock protein
LLAAARAQRQNSAAKFGDSVAIYKETDMAPMNGTIKRLVSDKGFGFIAAGDGNEYFFHQSACSQTAFDDLREGQAVTFDRGQGPKGPRAENVKLA